MNKNEVIAQMSILFTEFVEELLKSMNCDVDSKSKCIAD